MNEPVRYALEQPWSSRELEILRLLAEGLTNRQIANKLILSPETIKWYNKQIFEKLGVSSRTQAAAMARKLGLLGESKPSGVSASRPSSAGPDCLPSSPHSSAASRN